MCKAALPRHISSTEATIILIFNIFLPGVGTMLASIMGHACRCDTFLVGVCQMLTAPLIVGWIWSIWWGVAACGNVGKRDTREVDKEVRSGESRKSGKSNHHEREREHGHAHGSGSGSGHEERSARREDAHERSDEHGHGFVDAQPQQGFPQAYPDPSIPAPVYQPPYPADYPPTQPPV